MPRSDDSKLSYKRGLKYQVGLLLARFEKSENDAEDDTLIRMIPFLLHTYLDDPELLSLYNKVRAINSANGDVPYTILSHAEKPTSYFVRNYGQTLQRL